MAAAVEKPSEVLPPPPPPFFCSFGLGVNKDEEKDNRTTMTSDTDTDGDDSVVNVLARIHARARLGLMPQNGSTEPGSRPKKVVGSESNVADEISC